MTEPLGSFSFSAQMLAADKCAAGDALCFDSTLGYWRVASAANRASAATVTQAIALDPYGESVVGKVRYQGAGTLAQEISSLPVLTPSTTKKLVRVSTTGRLERIDSYTSGDDVVGYATWDGRVALHIGLPWDMIAALAGGGGALPAGTNNQVQTTVDGVTFHAPANVKAVDNAVSVGASASGTGFYRAPYGVGTVILGGKNSLGVDTKWIYIDSTDCLTFGVPNGSGMAGFLEGDTASGVLVDGLFAVYYDGSTHQIRNSFPRLGDGVAWGSSEGEAAETRTGAGPGGGALPIVVQGYASIIFSGAGTASFAFDAPPDSAHTYLKFVEETGGFDKILTNNSTNPPTGTTYTLKANTRRWVKITPNGVFECGADGTGVSALANVGTGTGTVWRNTTSGTANLKTLKAGSNITLTNNADDVTIAASGGSPAGSTGQLQTNNAGAFGAPGPYAGAAYVSIISGTPTTNGFRLGNTQALSGRNAAGSADLNLCQLDSSDVVIVGNLTGNTSVRAFGTLTLATNSGSTTAILTASLFSVNVPIDLSAGATTAGTILRIPDATARAVVAGTKTLIASSSTEGFLFSDSSFGNQCAQGRIYASAGMNIGISATNYITIGVTNGVQIGATGRNVCLGTNASYGGGVKVIGIDNASTLPTSNPVGGGILFCDAGALKYKGTSSAIATISPAEPHCPRCGTDVGLSECRNDFFGEHLIHCHACELQGRDGGGVLKHVTNFFEYRKVV